MKLQHLYERSTPSAAEMHPFLDKLCKLVFKTGCGPITDSKREGTFIGVAHHQSVITDKDGNYLYLTLDNSTASGEFELNSLSPLMIKKGGLLDLELRKLYREHGIKSRRKIGYIEKSGELVVREVHLGKTVDERTLVFIQDLMANLKHGVS